MASLMNTNAGKPPTAALAAEIGTAIEESIVRRFSIR
jgi:hypothetical protein